VCDRRVGQQALHVGLRQREQTPNHHRQGCEPDQYFRPDVLFSSERNEAHSSERGEAAGFGPGSQECRDWGARALIGIRGPRVKRHRRDLEGEAGNHERHSRAKQRILS